MKAIRILLVPGIVAALTACATESPAGPALPIEARMSGFGLGSGGRGAIAIQNSTVTQPENTVAADSTEAATTERGGVMFGSGN